MSYDLKALVAARRRRRRVRLPRPFFTPRTLGAPLEKLGRQVIAGWRDAVREQLMPELDRAGLLQDDTTNLGGFFDENDRLISGLVVRIAPGILNNWVVAIERWHRRKWAGSIGRAAGLDIESFMVPLNRDDQITAYQNWSLGLVKDLNASTRKRLEGLVYKAVTESTPRRVLAKDIAKAMGIERRRALVIARDQTTKLAGKLDQLRNEEAGIEEYEWVHSGKANPREAHVARDGKIFRWDTPPAGGPPGTEINCGCTSRAVISFD